MNVGINIIKILSIQFYFCSFHYQLHLLLNIAFPLWFGNVVSNLLYILHISVLAEKMVLFVSGFKMLGRNSLVGACSDFLPNKPSIVLGQNHDPVRAEQLHQELCKWSREQVRLQDKGTELNLAALSPADIHLLPSPLLPFCPVAVAPRVRALIAFRASSTTILFLSYSLLLVSSLSFIQILMFYYIFFHDISKLSPFTNSGFFFFFPMGWLVIMRAHKYNFPNYF